jgi:hypothetical protein
MMAPLLAVLVKTCRPRKGEILVREADLLVVRENKLQRQHRREESVHAEEVRREGVEHRHLARLVAKRDQHLRDDEAHVYNNHKIADKPLPVADTQGSYEMMRSGGLGPNAESATSSQ